MQHRDRVDRLVLAAVHARADGYHPEVLMIGDHDFVRVEHADAMRAAIPDARLAVVPDTTHNQLTHRVDIVAPIVDGFLAR